MTATSADAAIETRAEQAPSMATTTVMERLYWYRESIHITKNLFSFNSLHKLSDLVFFNGINIFRKKISSGGFFPVFRHCILVPCFRHLAPDWFRSVF
jgi:hypothetical protein